MEDVIYERKWPQNRDFKYLIPSSLSKIFQCNLPFNLGAKIPVLIAYSNSAQ